MFETHFETLRDLVGDPRVVHAAQVAIILAGSFCLVKIARTEMPDVDPMLAAATSSLIVPLLRPADYSRMKDDADPAFPGRDPFSL